MSNKPSRANSAKTPSVEVEKTNNNKPQDSAPVSVPAPSSEKPVTVKEYKPTIKEGAKVSTTFDAPDWAKELPGTVTFESKVSDANASGQTLFTLTVETENNITKFVNASVTQVKTFFGLAAVQRSGSYKVAVKTPEDIEKAVYKYTSDLAAAVDKVEKLLAVCGDFSVSVNVSGHGELYRLKLEKEASEARARAEAAKEQAAKKQAAKDLKNASEADRIKAAVYLSLSDVAKQITEAAAVCDWDRVAELAAEQSRLQAEAAKVTEAANNDGVNETAA